MGGLIHAAVGPDILCNMCGVHILALNSIRCKAAATDDC